MRAIGIACCTFLIVSFSGYTVYGEEVASDILVSFPQVRKTELYYTTHDDVKAWRGGRQQ